MNLTNMIRFLNKYFFLVVIVLLVSRITIVLLHFNFVLTDNDQALFWYGCHNFSKGIFYTPFIYGCNYGSMLESFIAVPFYKIGIPLYYALPLSNVFWIFLLCIILSHNLNKLHPKHQMGSLFIMIFSLLPTECYAILFAAKGHIAGILLALLSLIFVTKSTARPLLICSGLLAGLALQLNPNSVFLIIILFLFIPSVKNIIYVVIGMSGSLLYSLITSHYAIILDSEFLHKQWELTFKMSFLMEHINYLDKFLNNVTPLFGKMGFFSVLLPFILAIILLIKRDWLKGSVALFFVIILFTSFGFSKVSDGSVDVFFHYCRFYLALAFCNALIIPFILLLLPINKYYNILIVSILLITIIYLYQTPKQSINLANKQGETYAVQRKFVADIVGHCNWIDNELDKTKQNNQIIFATDYIYFSENLYLSTMNLKNVTCCFENYKKFYWLDKAMKNKKGVYDIFVIISFEDRLEKKMKECPQYLYKDKVSNYFLIRDIRQPAKFIENFLK